MQYLSPKKLKKFATISHYKHTHQILKNQARSEGQRPVTLFNIKKSATYPNLFATFLHIPKILLY